MAYSYAEIVNLADSGKTGREVSILLGITKPTNTTSTEYQYLMNTGNRIVASAREEVAEGNGHGLYGSNGKRRNGNGKKEVDSLLKIEDAFVVTMARGACMKGGLPETTGQALKDAIENSHPVICPFLDTLLTPEQRAILEKAIGVLTPAEREAKRRADLVSGIRMAVLKAMRLDGMRKELEAAGFLVEAPAWFADVSGIDLPNIEAHSTGELEAIADTVH